MKANAADLKWLSNPEIFRVNRIDAHSDHKYYENESEARMHLDMPLRQSLNGTWKFSFAKNPKERIIDFYKRDYPTAAFDFIQVPGHIQMQGYDYCQYVNVMYPWDGIEELEQGDISSEYNPVGSYVKHFKVDKNLKGKRTFISFQGVENAFYVWLNGEFIGYSEDTFTPSEFDITDYLEDENKLCVEVYKRSSGVWLEDQDFWRFSGIFRDVYLYAVPITHVRDLFIKTDLSDDLKDAKLNIELDIMGELNGKVTALLTDHNGMAVTSEIESVNMIQSLKLSLSVHNVHLWNGEDPYLYEVIITIYDANGKVVEIVPQKIGFRKIEIEQKIMKINGKRIVFKGVNRHEFNGYHGRVISKEDMLWDVKFMKKNNINAVRTSHYPNNSLWYELCDEYGIYLIDETNLETHSTWCNGNSIESALPGDKPKWKECVLDRASSMLERDKNHPAVIIWSCGNEAFGGSNIYAMSRFFKERDSSRIVHYEGIANDRRYEATTDMESRMYLKPADIRAYLENNPPKPFINCEYIHAMGNSLGGMKLYTDLEDEFEMYQGGFIWDYIDQSIIKIDKNGTKHFLYGGDFDEKPHDADFCGNGIIFADRTYSPKVQEVKFLYQNIRINPTTEGVTIDNRHLFTNTSAFEFERRILLDGKPICSECFETDIAPLAKDFITCPKIDMSLCGEYTIEIAAKLKADTRWEKAGYEVAWGQEIVKVEDAALNEDKSKTLRTAEGFYNYGVYGDDFSIMFSKQWGSPLSIKFAGKEYMKKAPMPTYWRAATENDNGNKHSYRCGMWREASLTQNCISNEIIKRSDKETTIVFTYKLWDNREDQVTVAYTVDAAGKITVKADFPGVEDCPELPLFGITMKMPMEYNQFKYYGNGPDENYIDRNNGAKLGIYSSNAKDNVTPYLLPQGCGNRTGMRWLTVTNGYGNGLKFSAVDEPLEFSVLPYSEIELDFASHYEELPNITTTAVSIMGKQMGVGGDDSWGAPVQEMFKIPSDRPMTFSYTIEKA